MLTITCSQEKNGEGDSRHEYRTLLEVQGETVVVVAWLPSQVVGQKQYVVLILCYIGG